MGVRVGERWIDSWHAAADRAAFVPFEAVGGETAQRWAGGFGGEPDETTHLGVASRIDGTDVMVDTSSRRSPTSAGHFVHELLSRHTLGRDDVELPLTLTVVGDDRDVRVDGEPVPFEGIRLEGEERWFGRADVDGLTVVVETSGRVDLALRHCRDVAALPEHPPDP